MTKEIAYRITKESEGNEYKVYIPSFEDAGYTSFTTGTDESKVDEVVRNFAGSMLYDLYKAGTLDSFKDNHLEDQGLSVCTLTEKDFN